MKETMEPVKSRSRTVAIIGGGVAGLSAAVQLAEKGIRPVIVESEPELGGKVKAYGCKGVRECVHCDVCLGVNLIKEVKRLGVERFKGAKVLSLSGRPGRYRLRLSVDGSSSTRTLSAGTIIVATGAEPFDPSVEKRLSHGQIKDVISAVEVEHQIRASGKLLVPSTGMAPKSVAFVQCVGSRDLSKGSGACSKACCKYSWKMAQLLKRIDPETSILYLFMDWRPVDAQDDIRSWAAGQKNVRLIRSRPSEVLLGEDGRPVVRFATDDDSIIEEEAVDLVILSVGMVPSAGSKELSHALRLEEDAQGFILTSELDRHQTSRPGVYAAGSCTGSKDIRESAKDGERAAGAAARSLEEMQ